MKFYLRRNNEGTNRPNPRAIDRTCWNPVPPELVMILLNNSYNNEIENLLLDNIFCFCFPI